MHALLFIAGELYIPENESHKQVAVKVLKDGANREVRTYMERERVCVRETDR